MRHLAKLFFYSLVTVGLVGCGPEAATTSKSTATKSSPTETDSQSSDQSESSDQGESTSSQPMAEKPVEETVAVAATGDGEGGNLTGRITLKGDIPPPRKLSITKDAATCGRADTIVDIEGTDGGVKNVVIEIRGVKGEDWKFKDPKDGYVLRQKDCQFKPNMVVVPVGKNISVYNDDPIGHNVNTGDWNQMQPAGPDPIVKPFDSRAPTKIGCNIHSWMEAWLYPVQNPYFAVTDAKGNFKIEGIPAGKYRINIWHAALGKKTARLTIEAGKAATLDHEFQVK